TSHSRPSATHDDNQLCEELRPYATSLFYTYLSIFFFNDPPTTEIYTLSLHDALPILTPSQLYVFMPPNLGGFFMVRSYYPSECHADYFDFERIEALKPAIEACGISTLSQSPMLGFHKQMDNRIKLLEE